MIEKTLVLIKPDAFSKGFVGNIISIYENSGLSVEKAKVVVPSKELLKKHYKDHKGKPFFDSLLNFMSGGKIMALVVSGDSAIERVRAINGATDPEDAADGTIRNLYGTNIEKNAVHGSKNPIAAKEELSMWFE
ncbi:MAG TPA: nucleoside-diphosphate kinase [Clostridia bacterium]|nr:nucleoside-diphosphate kinase [Clostridia bacterium]